MPMSIMNLESIRRRRIVRVSLITRILLLVGAVLTTISWVAPALNQSGQLLFQVGPLQITWRVWSHWPTLHTDLSGIGLSPFLLLVLPRVLVFLMVVYQLLRLFGFYQQGSIFSFQHVLCLRRIGGLMVLWSLMLLTWPMLFGTLVKLLAGDYEGYWLSAGWDALFYLISGMALVVMAWVMDEGLQIQAEQELTI